MSFSDLMSSAKGPGVIGLLLGLTVLGGFLILGTVTLDEAFQGGKSPGNAVRNQAQTITDLQLQLKISNDKLANAKDREAIAKTLEDKLAEVASAEAEIANKKLSLVQGAEALENSRLTFEDYKNKYRTEIRNNAKGKSLPNLTTLDGESYTDVTIGEVNAIGMSITHQSGVKRIPYANLPRDMQDLYQFDPDEKRKQETLELTHKKSHLLANDAVQRAEKQNQQQLAEEQERAARIHSQNAVMELGTKIDTLSSQIMRLESDIRNESYKRISRAPIMREQLTKLKRELELLESKRSSLRSNP